MLTTPDPANATAQHGDSQTHLVPREGSSLYYSLLRCSSEQRAHLVDTLGLIDAMSLALFDVSEPAVAEKKIHWWHEEIDRLHNAQARHPATTRVQRLFAGNDNARLWCLDVLSIAATERYTPATTEAIANDRLAKDYGARLALVTLILDPGHSELLRNQASLAQALGLCHRLRLLPKLLHRGYDVFSEERYRQHGFIAHALYQSASNHGSAVSGSQRRAFEQQLVDEAIALFDQAMSEEPFVAKKRYASLLPILVNSELRRQQLLLWQKTKPELLKECVSLTPLRKLFHTWRCRRRHS